MLATLAGGLGELANQGGLGSAGRSGDQRAAASEQATPQHSVETLKTSGHSFGRGFMNNFRRFGEGHFDPGETEAERRFTGRKARSAIFGDLEPVRRNPYSRRRSKQITQSTINCMNP